MKHKLKILITILLFSTITMPGLLYAEKYYNGLTITASAGPSYITGYYKEYLEPGFNAGVGTIYSLPFFQGNTYFTSGFSYYSYSLDASSSSIFSQNDFYAGGMFTYPLFSFIFIDAGASIHGIYSMLNTKNTDRNETTFKPGASLSAGSMVYLGRGIGLFVNAEYRISAISSEYFETATITAGATYSYIDYKNDIKNSLNADKKINLFDQGINEFRKKNFYEAKKLFSDLYTMDNAYPGLDYYLKRISEIEQNYSTAETYLQEKNYLKAISYFESCSPYIKECEMKLFQQRKNLKTSVPSWENQGIKLYEEKHYRECINIMEKILIVDPENKNANIYLPRAVKRNKALESLQSE